MIEIPVDYNYISAFLTFSCNLDCGYCINKYNGLYKYTHLSVNDWIEGLNNIRARKDLPITLSGGEPTLYPAFFEVVNNVHRPMDILTNGSFDVYEFISNTKPETFSRGCVYPSIRISYHPGITNIMDLAKKVLILKNAGYKVGIYSVNIKSNRLKIKSMEAISNILGLWFENKEYLDNRHGTFKFKTALNGVRKNCICKPSELLIAPDGRLFRCHYELYHGINSYGHLLDKSITLPDDHIPCVNYGLCSPCDVKIKKDRFQNEEHCSVDIIEVQEGVE